MQSATFKVVLSQEMDCNDDCNRSTAMIKVQEVLIFQEFIANGNLLNNLTSFIGIRTQPY